MIPINCPSCKMDLKPRYVGAFQVAVAHPKHCRLFKTITSIEALSWRPGRFEKETDAKRSAKCKRCKLGWDHARFVDYTAPCQSCQMWQFESQWKGEYILWACSWEKEMFPRQAESFENAIERLDRKRKERMTNGSNHSKRS